MIAWTALFLGASALAWQIGGAIAWWRVQIRAARRHRIYAYEEELFRQWGPSLRGLGREARAAAIAAQADSLPETDLLAFREFGTLIYDKLSPARRAALEQKASRRA